MVLACFAWYVYIYGWFTLCVCLSTPCRGCRDRPLGTSYMWKMRYGLWVHRVETMWIDHQVHIVDYGYTVWKLCEQTTRYILWIMGRPYGGCKDRPLGTYRLVLWTGTPCEDYTDRPLGTPRFIGMTWLVMDAYTTFYLWLCFFVLGMVYVLAICMCVCLRMVHLDICLCIYIYSGWYWLGYMHV